MSHFKTPTMAADLSIHTGAPQRSVLDRGMNLYSDSQIPTANANTNPDNGRALSRTGVLASIGTGSREAIQLITILGEGYRLLCLSQCKEAIHAFVR